MIEVNIKGQEKKYPIHFEQGEIEELKSKIIEYMN